MADGWRWNVRRHLTPIHATIAVTEPSKEAIEERQRRIREGAAVVPFGFSRVLPRPAVEPAEPMLWDGDDG